MTANTECRHKFRGLRHPTINLNEFNNNYLNILLQIFSKEKKIVFLLGDFNVDLLKYDKHAGTNEFIDSLFSYMYFQCIYIQLE